MRLTTQDEPLAIVIPDNVWFASNSVILKGTEIGEESIVAVNSIVRGAFPPRCLISGNPATVVKDYSKKNRKNQE